MAGRPSPVVGSAITEPAPPVPGRARALSVCVDRGVRSSPPPVPGRARAPSVCVDRGARPSAPPVPGSPRAPSVCVDRGARPSAPPVPGSPRALDPPGLAAVLAPSGRCGPCVVREGRERGPFRSPTPWRDRHVVVVGLTAPDAAPESAPSATAGLRGSTESGQSARPRVTAGPHGRRGLGAATVVLARIPVRRRPSAPRRRLAGNPPRPGGLGTGPRSPGTTATHALQAKERVERATGPKRAASRATGERGGVPALRRSLATPADHGPTERAVVPGPPAPFETRVGGTRAVARARHPSASTRTAGLPPGRVPLASARAPTTHSRGTETFRIRRPQSGRSGSSAPTSLRCPQRSHS
jgi:hypothetical protein